MWLAVNQWLAVNKWLAEIYSRNLGNDEYLIKYRLACSVAVDFLLVVGGNLVVGGSFFIEIS